MIDVTDIATLRSLLESGETTALAIAQHSLRRIAAIDRNGDRLNSVPVLNPGLLADASRLDATPAAARGPLHGIPFTVKDSFAVRGLTVAAGSPAFATLRAADDAVVVERLRAAGALLIGKTNMPPMAIGGGQAGLYGRTRSPYNPEYLAAAWHSGSSIGSAVSVAAGLCVFGIGEETVSSGRSPASNNALVAYTPSWGVVPGAGNWPLHAYRDTVVPHTRSIADLVEVLAVVAEPDERDVWLRQTAVEIESRAAKTAADLVGRRESRLDGVVVGVPRLYVGEPYDDVAPVPLRPSILALFERWEAALAAAGAIIVRVPFPLVESYEKRSEAATPIERYVDPEWTAFELGGQLSSLWQGFLDSYAVDPFPLSELSPAAIRPDPPFVVDAVENGRVHPGRDVFDFSAILRDPPPSPEVVRERAAAAIRGLVRGREELYESWLDDLGIDFLAFPANSDVGAWDSDVNPSSAHAAWADGSVFSTMNHVMRRFGIPSVTVPMGLMDDTGMPVGATICGRAYADADLVAWAAAIERITPSRATPAVVSVTPLGLVGESESRDTAGARLEASSFAEIQPDGNIVVRTTVTSDLPAVLEVGAHRHDLPAGKSHVVTTLHASLRRLHNDTSVLVLATVLGGDGGLVVAASAEEVPFTRIDPLAAQRANRPSHHS